MTVRPHIVVGRCDESSVTISGPDVWALGERYAVEDLRVYFYGSTYMRHLSRKPGSVGPGAYHSMRQL